ncbi:hypothetical protein H6G93_33095 [Nostoc sp. FACHB-973]|nr:hypothetical protein [Nostoc sp. FACHB-973]
MTYTLWLHSSDHPEILGMSDFNKLSQSLCLYDRKFDITNETIKNLDL